MSRADFAAIVISAHDQISDEDIRTRDGDLDVGDCSCGEKNFIDHAVHLAGIMDGYGLFDGTQMLDVSTVVSEHRSAGLDVSQERCTCGVQIGAYHDPRDLLAMHRLQVIDGLLSVQAGHSEQVQQSIETNGVPVRAPHALPRLKAYREDHLVYVDEEAFRFVSPESVADQYATANALRQLLVDEGHQVPYLAITLPDFD